MGCPAGGGVGCGGYGFAAQQRGWQQQRSGDGGGSGRRTRRLAHPRASENGGGGGLTCHVRGDSGRLLRGDQIWEGLGRDSEDRCCGSITGVLGEE